MIVTYDCRKRCFPHTNLVIGEYDYRGVHYEFEAICHTKPQPNSINNGHITRLFINNLKKNTLVLAYDDKHMLGDEDMYHREMVRELLNHITNHVVSYSECNK